MIELGTTLDCNSRIYQILARKENEKTNVEMNDEIGDHLGEPAGFRMCCAREFKIDGKRRRDPEKA